MDTILSGKQWDVSVAWRRADGSRLWSIDRLKYRKLTAPPLWAFRLSSVTMLVCICCLATDGPRTDFANRMHQPCVAALVVAADTLVVVTRNGGIYGFRPD